MDSNLQTKLQQFSATPPDGVWDKIAGVLDTKDNYATRLFHYEEQPPAAAWEKIENDLQERAAPATVVPFTTRFRKPLRYIAAASIIGVVLVTITLSVKRTEAGAIDAGSTTTVPTHRSSDVVQNKAAQPVTTPLQQGRDVGNGTAAQQENDSGPAEKNQSIAANSNRSNNGPKEPTAAYASLNNYVLFSDGDGKLRKVSKKLAGMVQCKDGDGACQQRLLELRQKLAANAMNTDFTGILEMLHQLQQKP